MIVNVPLLRSMAVAFSLLVVSGAASPAIAEEGGEYPDDKTAERAMGPGGQPSYAQKLALLSPTDRKILAQGEIGSGKIIGSVLLAGTIGFGAGHALLGTVDDGRWKFAVGEVASIVVMGYGLGKALLAQDSDGNEGEILGVGLIGFGVFRIWELMDVMVVSQTHNDRHRAAYDKAVGLPPSPPMSFFVIPGAGKGGGFVGRLSLTF